MTFDYVLLWVLVVFNTFVSLLIIRQLAALPKVIRRPGPRPGLVLGDWVHPTSTGRQLRSSELPTEYTLLFVSGSCQPCRSLLEEIHERGRPQGMLVLVSQDDGQALSAERPDATADFLLPQDRDLYERLSIPGTPFAVKIQDGKVVRAAAAPTLSMLAEVVRAANAEPVRSPA